MSSLHPTEQPDCCSLLTAAPTCRYALPGWQALPPEYAIPERAPSLEEAQQYCVAAGALRITRIFRSSPGFCPSICTSTSTTSMPTAGSPTIWATRSATSSNRCCCWTSGKPS